MIITIVEVVYVAANAAGAAGEAAAEAVVGRISETVFDELRREGFVIQGSRCVGWRDPIYGAYMSRREYAEIQNYLKLSLNPVGKTSKVTGLAISNENLGMAQRMGAAARRALERCPPGLGFDLAAE